MDRLDRGHAWRALVQDRIEQPVPDPAHGRGAPPGLARAGSGDAALGRRLAPALWPGARIGRDLCRRQPLPGHVLPRGQLDRSGADRRTGPTGSRPAGGSRAQARARVSAAAQLAPGLVRTAGVAAPAADPANARAGRLGGRGVWPLPSERPADRAADDDGARFLGPADGRHSRSL